MLFCAVPSVVNVAEPELSSSMRSYGGPSSGYAITSPDAMVSPPETTAVAMIRNCSSSHKRPERARSELGQSK